MSAVEKVGDLLSHDAFVTQHVRWDSECHRGLAGLTELSLGLVPTK